MSAVSRPVFSRVYPRMSGAAEKAGLSGYRTRLLAGLTGEVVEIGAGHGVNFAHYPGTVTRVLAVEPEARLREAAEAAARDAPVPVEVVDGLAGRLPASDHSFDAAVCSLVLCSIPDPHAALREARRVLRPGGELRFLEHVRAPTPGLIRAQRVLDATVWPLLFGGCHTGRDTEAAVVGAGFTVDRVERFLFPRAKTPASFHVLGVARRQE